MSEPTPFYTRWAETAQDWVNQNIGARFGDTTNALAETIEKSTEKKVTASAVKTYTPYVAAAATAGAGLLLAPHLSKIGKKVSDVAHLIVTGNGHLEKIPVIGSVFTGAGWVVDQIGDYSGYIVTGLASLLSFNLFKSKATPPSGDPANTPHAGTGARAQEPEYLILQDPKTKEKHKTPLRPFPVPASGSTVRLVKENIEMGKSGDNILAKNRSDAIRQNKTDLAEQIRVIMQEENQRYENRRLFLTRVEEFSAIDAGRRKLVTSLSTNGLTAPEAETLVPGKINLRGTVTPGKTATENSTADGKNTDFGGEYAQLVSFGQKIETFYGKGYFNVSELKDGKRIEVRPAFDAMSVTQQHEYIEKALEHARTKYAQLSPCVYNTSCVTSANYAGGTVSHSVVRDFKKIPSSTYHHADGSSGKVVEPGTEYDFLGGLNTNVVRNVNFGNGISGYNVRGESLDRGKGLSAVTGVLNQWQNLINDHKEELKRHETAYNGEITRYTRNMRFCDQSLGMNARHGIAPLRADEFGLHLRDVRTFTPGKAPNTKDLITWKGDWTDATRTSYTVRTIYGRDKSITLPQPVTLNLTTGEGVDAFLTQMDQALAGPSVEQPITIDQIDRTPRAPRARVTDNRSVSSPQAHWFAGRYEGKRFIATGYVAPACSITIPECPKSELLPLRTSADYEAEGQSPVYGTYLGHGRRCCDVTLKGPDGKVKTYILEVGSGFRSVDLIAGYEKIPGSKAGCGPDYTIMDMPETKVTYKQGTIANKDEDYLRTAKGLAAHIDNRIIQRENVNRERNYLAQLSSNESFRVTPLAQEFIVGNIDNTQEWQPLLNTMRYDIGNIGPKGPTCEKDPFKKSKHMVSLTDKYNNKGGTYVAHGDYNEATKKFTLHGYEYRHPGLPGDKPGIYKAMEGTLDFAVRDFEQFFKTAESGLQTGLMVEKEKNNDGLLIVSDYRDKNFPQKFALCFEQQPDKTHKLKAWLHCDEKLMKEAYGIEAFALGVKPGDCGITVSEVEYNAIVNGERSIDTIVDKLDTFGKNKITVEIPKLDDKFMTFRVTDKRNLTPVVYEMTGTIDVKTKTMEITSITKNGKITTTNDPATWLNIIDGKPQKTVENKQTRLGTDGKLPRRRNAPEETSLAKMETTDAPELPSQSPATPGVIPPASQNPNLFG